MVVSGRKKTISRYLSHAPLPTPRRFAARSVTLRRLESAHASIALGSVTFHQLHHDATRVVGFFESVDLRDTEACRRVETPQLQYNLGNGLVALADLTPQDKRGRLETSILRQEARRLFQ